MLYATIDCGTTNSRVYIVDGDGKVLGKAVKTVGVKDTATTGSRDMLRNGLKEIIAQAAQRAGVSVSELGAVLSSGMITSEIGLHEIPHLMAPAGVKELAETITRVPDAGIVDEEVPVYFVRGIKNKMDEHSDRAPSDQVGELDFMRGEETQVAGILAQSGVSLPTCIVILSSHTKFISVDSDGVIRGSLTTMSGQVYDAVKNHTFISKSVVQGAEEPSEPDGYFDKTVVDNAVNWVDNVGLIRSLMFPRFMDVLLDTTWYERHLFLESLIAADDMQAIKQLETVGAGIPDSFVLIGREERCCLYEYILSGRFPKAEIKSISDTEEIDKLSIQGVLSVARKAGIVK